MMITITYHYMMPIRVQVNDPSNKMDHLILPNLIIHCLTQIGFLDIVNSF